jgi:hypothetical protein
VSAGGWQAGDGERSGWQGQRGGLAAHCTRAATGRAARPAGSSVKLMLKQPDHVYGARWLPGAWASTQPHLWQVATKGLGRSSPASHPTHCCLPDPARPAGGRLAARAPPTPATSACPSAPPSPAALVSALHHPACMSALHHPACMSALHDPACMSALHHSTPGVDTPAQKLRSLARLAWPALPAVPMDPAAPMAPAAKP